MTEPEVIRISEDGTPLYVDWDSPESLTNALQEIPPEPPEVSPQTRASQESQQWSVEKRAQIEARLNELTVSLENQRKILEMPTAMLVAGIERWYSAAETARFFGRTNQWIYERLRNEKFRYKDGTPIRGVTAENGWARFNLDIIREIALSCYRSGTVKRPELEVILSRLQQAEVGEVLFDPEEG